MKIGIITFHHAPSYGAFYQAYALQTYLKSQGHEAVVIDYMPTHREDAIRKRWCVPWSWHCLGVNRRNLRCLDLIKMRNRCVFSRTVHTYYNLSDRYASLDELRARPPQIEACFCGSDQIWNPETTGGTLDEAYFAGFGPPEMLRVAYAGSFGKRELPEQAAELRRYLQRLDSLSVREATSVSLLKDRFRLDAALVADPTFLLNVDQFPEEDVFVPPEGYILTYLLTDSPVAKAVTEKIEGKLGLPVLDVRSATRFLGMPVQPTPLQLLRLFRNARYVVTDSFHGTSLSIIFRVDFTTIALSGRRANRIVRHKDLLKTLGLLDRFVGPDGCPPEETECGPVSWDGSERALEQLRDASRGFIDEALHRKKPAPSAA